MWNISTCNNQRQSRTRSLILYQFSWKSIKLLHEGGKLCFLIPFFSFLFFIPFFTYSFGRFLFFFFFLRHFIQFMFPLEQPVDWIKLPLLLFKVENSGVSVRRVRKFFSQLWRYLARIQKVSFATFFVLHTENILCLAIFYFLQSNPYPEKNVAMLLSKMLYTYCKWMRTIWCQIEWRVYLAPPGFYEYCWKMEKWIMFRQYNFLIFIRFKQNIIKSSWKAFEKCKNF